jgi:glycerol-3-phosphate dehydrogenase (NAD(P)+)
LTWQQTALISFSLADDFPTFSCNFRPGSPFFILENSSLPVLTIIGGGSWATAIVKILSEQAVRIRWWLRNPETVQYMNTYGHNPRYLSDVQMDLEKVTVFTDLHQALQTSDYVIVTVPAAFLQEALAGITPSDLSGKMLVSGVKGMIPDKNLLVTDYLTADFEVPESQLCVIAGPCHAEEVALEKQSYLTIACKNLQNAETFAGLMTCRYVQASAIQDVDGVEYCAVMKNIIALACGITHGLNYGDNFQAVLVSNAMQEIRNFLDVIYPFYRDLSGSAYLGDLLVTAYSQFSRNRMFGNMIGRGYSVKSAQMEMNMIAEGYYAVKSIHELNNFYHVEMPIVSMVYNILYKKLPPAKEVQKIKEMMK